MRGMPYVSAMSGWWEWTGTEVRPRWTHERCASVLIQEGVGSRGNQCEDARVET